MTVTPGVEGHHGPVMEVGGQNKWLTEDPVNHCGRLWFPPSLQPTLGEADIIPGGEISVEINVIGIESSGTFSSAYAIAFFTFFKPFVQQFILFS